MIIQPTRRAAIQPIGRLSLVLGVLMTLSGIPAIALGHAELDTVTPADKSTVQTPPTEIVMTFTEPMKPANSSIKLVDASNKVIVEGSTVDTNDTKTMRLPIDIDLGAGTYTVRWTSTSADDNDVAHGTTTFTVAESSAPPSDVPSAAAPTLSASAVGTSSASSAVPSVAPSPPPTTPATSSTDAVIPVVVALIVLAGLGLWLMRGRSRAGH